MSTPRPLVFTMILALSCSASEDDRRQHVQSEELSERLEWLRTETDPSLRRGALSVVVFYCQQKSVDAACRELQYQLVWGGREAADMIATFTPIAMGGWKGKVPAAFWNVAYRTASTEEAKRALLRASWSADVKP